MSKDGEALRPQRCIKGKPCGALNLVLGGVHKGDRTGIVRSMFPPFLVGIRYGTGKRGEYQVLIFEQCPWCGVRIAPPLHRGR